MKRAILKFTAITTLAAAIAATPVLLGAADANTGASAAKSDLPGPAKFQGTISAVDTKAKTFTVDGQTFTVTGEAHITRNGGLATLADAVVGESARGTCTKRSDGKLVVTRVRFGEGTSAMSAAEADSNQPALTKFYGTISAVDTNAMTFTVDDQTLAVTGNTRMTKATSGEAATLADAVVGDPARGSYTKTSSGKLEVTKVRFGKKTGGKGSAKHGGKKKTSADSQKQDE